LESERAKRQFAFFDALLSSLFNHPNKRLLFVGRLFLNDVKGGFLAK